ncbi:hypothetical protein [Actinokineospora bangkokensis]|uniref:hypothetical protein n=1 Tax=Actinokineospora bangkokensis TaxID=1193682 RepID=UPI001301750D|nr:hypothetical protein [Actinokineospora bangkokensis]
MPPTPIAAGCLPARTVEAPLLLNLAAPTVAAALLSGALRASVLLGGRTRAAGPLLGRAVGASVLVGGGWAGARLLGRAGRGLVGGPGVRARATALVALGRAWLLVGRPGATRATLGWPRLARPLRSGAAPRRGPAALLTGGGRPAAPLLPPARRQRPGAAALARGLPRAGPLVRAGAEGQVGARAVVRLGCEVVGHGQSR